MRRLFGDNRPPAAVLAALGPARRSPDAATLGAGVGSVADRVEAHLDCDGPLWGQNERRRAVSTFCGRSRRGLGTGAVGWEADLYAPDFCTP